MKDAISILYSLAASTHEEGRKEKPSFSGSSGLGSARRNCRAGDLREVNRGTPVPSQDVQTHMTLLIDVRMENLYLNGVAKDTGVRRRSL